MQRAVQHFFCWPSGARGGLAPRLSVAGRELCGYQIAEARMGPFTVVLHPPLLDLAPRVIERDEDLLIETLLAQAAVE